MRTGKSTPLGRLPEPRGIFCSPGAHMKDARWPRKRQTRREAGAQNHGCLMSRGSRVAEGKGTVFATGAITLKRAIERVGEAWVSWRNRGHRSKADRALGANL